MGKKLAIKGHVSRGKEVIELFKMMGGCECGYSGGVMDCYYYISQFGNIEASFKPYEFETYIVYTLEEFLEKYPFKVGDKIFLYDNITEGCVTGMEWDENKGTVKYCVYTSAEYWCDVKELLKWNAEFLVNKEKGEEVGKMLVDITLSHLHRNHLEDVLTELLNHIKNTPKEELEREFERIKEWSNVGPTVEEFMTFCECVNKKPPYPKTYNECYNILNCFSFTDVEQYNFENDWRLTIKDKNYGNIMNAFVKLLICRDTYWKIAGDEMGLDKPWEPDLENEELYCIQNYNKQITISRTNTAFNKILIFPTEKMRDVFYENFKDLIEQCKELL